MFIVHVDVTVPNIRKTCNNNDNDKKDVSSAHRSRFVFLLVWWGMKRVIDGIEACIDIIFLS